MEQVTLNPIEAFAAIYLNHYFLCDVPDFHREMYALAYSNDKRIVIAAPRSFAKSTVFSVIYPLYRILEGDFGPGKANKIVLVSATSELAEDWLRTIKEELTENKFIIADYGLIDEKNSILWRQDKIIFQHPSTGKRIIVEAKGAGKQVRGKRPDIIILDDLESDEGVASSEQREKLLNWFNKALINTLEKYSQLIMVGTTLHPLSLLCDVLNRKGYTTRKYQAITPEGESLWPEKWPLEALLERKEEIGVLAFNSEYQNDPLIAENPIIWRDWLVPYESDSATFTNEIAKGVNTVVAIDPAISRKQGADYTAILAVSATFGDKPKFYVRRPIRGRWTIHEQVIKLTDYYEKYGGNKMIIETVAYQQALEDEVKRYCEENRKFYNIVAVKPDRDKERRAHAVASMIQAGDVLFDFDDVMTQRLMDELIVFPTGDHDDLVDALVMCLTELKEWSGRKRYEQTGPYIVLPNGGERRNRWTGVV